MQLSELIEKEGIESVSNKTNISIENLENLQAGNFEKLNRVKSLGFVNIIERDYEIELDGLRSEIKSYFDMHHSSKDDEVVMLSPDRIEESGSGIFKWVLILGLLYGLWYLYSHGKFEALMGGDDQEMLLEDEAVLESNVSSVDANRVIIKKENNRELITIDTTKKKDSTQPNGDESPKKSDGVAVVEPKEEKIATNNATQPSETVKKEESSTPQVVASVESLTLKEHNNTAFKLADEETTTNNTDTPTITNLTVNPTRGMLWFGFINLDTKKKKEFMTRESTPFNLKDGRWILLTGHGYLEIVSDLGTVKVTKNIREKHYFYLDAHEIKEIDRKEFKQLNGGRGW